MPHETLWDTLPLCFFSYPLHTVDFYPAALCYTLTSPALSDVVHKPKLELSILIPFLGHS